MHRSGPDVLFFPSEHSPVHHSARKSSQTWWLRDVRVPKVWENKTWSSELLRQLELEEPRCQGKGKHRVKAT